MDTGMTAGMTTALFDVGRLNSGAATPVPEQGNEARLLAAFAGALGIDPATVHDGLSYNSIPEWDSVGHMAFVTEVEALFEILLDADDIVDMSSYGEIRRILRNYGVHFEA